MDKHRSAFLNLSAELTGYSAIDLEGTGLVDQYAGLLEYEIGNDVSDILYDTSDSVLKLKGESREHAMQIEIVSSPLLWPVCQSLILLWYLGQWTRMTGNWYKYYAHINPSPGSPAKNVPLGKSFVPSAQAYTEQLSYRAAGAHPPGAHPTGFGGWGIDPVFGDFTSDKKKS
jgi:hypothetical protein